MGTIHYLRSCGGTEPFDADPAPLRYDPLCAAVWAFLLVGTVAFWFAVGWLLIAAWADTGRDCPGADPEWMGWCSQAPQVLP